MTSGLVRKKIDVPLSHESDELNDINLDIVQPSLDQQRVHNFDDSAHNDQTQRPVHRLLERRNAAVSAVYEVLFEDAAND